MFKDIISAPRIFKDPRITSNGKYRYRLIDIIYNFFVSIVDRADQVCFLGYICDEYVEEFSK